MATRREILRLAERLASAPTVSYREHEVLARIRGECDRRGVAYAADRWGNLILRCRAPRARGRPVAFVAHADHPGLIVTASRGRHALARWIGGVQPRYFPGARVRVETQDGPVRGRITGSRLGANGRVSSVTLDLARPVAAGSIGGWDVTPFRRDNGWIRTKSADDLLGCAALLALMGDLRASRPAIDVWGIVTRAEEDGLIGATAMAGAGTLPRETAVISIETSRELPCGRIGKGPIVRVGDRMSTFDPAVSQALREAAQEMAKRNRGFRYQRGLMDGGTCEASAFQAFGYRVGAVALPLGNYHNMGRRAIGAEYVHQDDLVNLVRLLPAAAARIATTRDGLSGIRKSFRKGLARARRELLATRGAAALGILIGLFAAGPALARSPARQAGDTAPLIMKTGGGRILPEASLARQADPLEDYDALHYDLTIRIDTTAKTFAGEVTMRVKALVELNSVQVDMGDNLTADSAAALGQRCTFSRPSSGRLEVTLPGPIPAGDSVEVYVRYAGAPGPAYFPDFKFFKNHGQGTSSFPVVSTLSEPDRARTWWPCKDRLDDKATVQLTVDAPEGFVITSNGNPTRSGRANGLVYSTWQTNYPITTYLVAFAASNYASWRDTYHAADGDSIPLYFYAYPEDSANARVDFSAAHEALGTYERLFGPYPYRSEPSRGHEKYGFVEFAWSNAGEEHQTISFIGDALITGNHAYDVVLAHETSHQWWGDAVTTASVNDMWLNEGFATYCESLFLEARDPVHGYRRHMQRLRNPAGEFEYQGSVVQSVEPFDPFSPTVYHKGAWVLHQLRGMLGDSLFFQCLHVYYDRYKFDYATTDKFIRTVEETAQEDLHWFFIPWLYGNGRPFLAWDWQDEGVGPHGNRIHLLVTQTQDPIPYPNGAPVDNPPSAYAFPMEVRFFGAGDSTSRRVFMGKRIFDAVIDSLPWRPDSIALDPDEWILREIQPRGTALASTQLTSYPNPTIGPASFWAQASPAGPIHVGIFDATGRRVRALPLLPASTLPQQASWDGYDAAGHRVRSGIYLLRIEGSAGTQSAKIIVMR